MSPVKRKRIAQKGAKALHASGKAHQWTPEEAQAARAKQGKEEE
jgi:hypothetical protein